MKTKTSRKLKQAGLLIWEAAFLLAIAAGGAVYLIYRSYTQTKQVVTSTNQPFQNIPSQRTEPFLGQ